MFKTLEDQFEFAPVPLRLGLAALFIFTGITKLMDPQGNAMFFSGLGIPAAEILVWVVIAIELLGGLALALGFLTRLAAIGLSIFVLVALILAYIIPWPPQNMLLFMFHWPALAGLLTLIFSGPGKWSLDERFYWE